MLNLTELNFVIQLSVPNANVDKKTHVNTDGTQSGEEYRLNQDITAPPDPVAVTEPA